LAQGSWSSEVKPRGEEYLATLDDTAWGAASDVVPKFISPSDPAAQWTGAHKGPAFFAYSDNYLIDVKFGVIVDVEASRSIRQAEVGAARTMIERTEERFGLKPERLVGDTAYGAAPMLNWLVEEKGIAPHIPVFDKSKRDDGTFSRSDFRYDPTADGDTIASMTHLWCRRPLQQARLRASAPRLRSLQHRPLQQPADPMLRAQSRPNRRMRR
jgi:hypothetical protein